MAWRAVAMRAGASARTAATTWPRAAAAVAASGRTQSPVASRAIAAASGLAAALLRNLHLLVLVPVFSCIRRPRKHVQKRILLHLAILR